MVWGLVLQVAQEEAALRLEWVALALQVQLVALTQEQAAVSPLLPQGKAITRLQEYLSMHSLQQSPVLLASHHFQEAVAALRRRTLRATRLRAKAPLLLPLCRCQEAPAALYRRKLRATRQRASSSRLQTQPAELSRRTALLR